VTVFVARTQTISISQFLRNARKGMDVFDLRPSREHQEHLIERGTVLYLRRRWEDARCRSASYGRAGIHSDQVRVGRRDAPGNAPTQRTSTAQRANDAPFLFAEIHFESLILTRLRRPRSLHW